MHKKIVNRLQRLTSIASVLSLLTLALAPAATNAAVITPRSLALSTSVVSVTASHTFTFTVPSTSTLGSIKFEYCVDPLPANSCGTVAGLNTSSATLGSVSGQSGSWSINTATARTPYISRTAAAGANASTTVVLNNITNPSTPNQTFYVRITTYSGTDGATGATDAGSVAASTASQIVVNASVQETLAFCIYEAGTCSSPTGDLTVNLGILNTTTAQTGTSKMSVSTNAKTGFTAQYSGANLGNGTDTITAIGGTAAASSPGSEQFGFNAANPTGTAPIGTASANYSNGSNYAYVAGTPTTFASSSGAVNDTVYTLTWLANISGITESGSYTTTVTFLCTAAF